MPLKSKIFLIRIFAAVLIICASFPIKQYNPDLSFYIKNQISYNLNFEAAAQTAKNIIRKHSIFYPQAGS